MRKPLQGVVNILRFNWHFYLLALGCILLLAWFWRHLPLPLGTLAGWGLALTISATVVSLLVSIYIYDCSLLHTLRWLDPYQIPPTGNLVNIHSGFDETSLALQEKFPAASLTVLDFYNPAQHTEISIRRARRAYPVYPGTIAVSTSALPIPDHTVDFVFLILAAHEIRDDEERVLFFNEISRLLKPGGRVLVLEHLRDAPNLLAYHLGAFHFLTLRTWKETFTKAGLAITHTRTHTPFLHLFILQRHGTRA